MLSTDRRHALCKVLLCFAIRNTVEQRNDMRGFGILTGRGTRVASRQHADLRFLREPCLEEVRKDYEYYARILAGSRN